MFPSPQRTLTHTELHECAQYARVRMARQGMEWMFAMPLYTLARYFGDSWVRKHLFDNGFLKPPSRMVSREEQQRVGMQGYLLAESLFNLQSHENFADIYDRMAKGEIEPCIGELEVARYFSLKDERFRFRKPIGRRGQDFDLEWFKDGVLVCCEVETKLESRILDSQGVWKTLDHARQQLPKDQPGLIFLRVLGHSDRDSLTNTTTIVKTAVDRLFRQSGRLLGVIMLTRVYWGGRPSGAKTYGSGLHAMLWVEVDVAANS